VSELTVWLQAALAHGLVLGAESLPS